MTELSMEMAAAEAAVSNDVAGSPTERDRMREFLLRYHDTLRLVESLAFSLLDCSQSDADPITPEKARARRHTAGEALAAVERGEALLKELWRAFDIDRRMAPAAPPPQPLKHDRRKKQRKGSAA